MVRFQQPVFKQFGCDLQPERKTDSMEVKKMAFMNELYKQMTQENQTTENGAIGYRTSGKQLLDANFAVSSMRDWGNERIRQMFTKVYYENLLLAVKWLFYLRDVRGEGMGERHTFRVCMNWLLKNHYEYAKNVVSLIPEYGRFDDWFCMLDTQAGEEIIHAMKMQLMRDLEAVETGGQVSLLAKWLPSCHTSSAETRKLARDIYQAFGFSEEEYRKILSKLRAYLNVVEVKMSANRWDDIDYSKVTSRANLIYGRAFLKNDEMRRRDFLNKLVRGEEKIHAHTLFPSDIVSKYYERGSYRWKFNLKAKDDTLEALWKALPDHVSGDASTLVVRDGSGSMIVNVGNTDMTALDVATALAIYFSEHCRGEFKNQFITFSACPQFVDLSCTESLRDKLEICSAYDECSNTDIQAVFQLILNTALANDMPQEDMPRNILIISDMEFDSAVTYPGSLRRSEKGGLLSLFEQIRNEYESNGYQMPRLVFWNVYSRTNTIPLQQNEAGVALVSGFNPTVYQMVLSDELDPYRCLLQQLNAKRYDAVEQALGEKRG